MFGLEQQSIAGVLCVSPSVVELSIHNFKIGMEEGQHLLIGLLQQSTGVTHAQGGCKEEEIRVDDGGEDRREVILRGAETRSLDPAVPATGAVADLKIPKGKVS